MASNKIPSNYHDLLALAADAKIGALNHESRIGLKQNDALAIGKDHDAARVALGNLAVATTAVRRANALVQELDAQVATYLASAKGTLVAAMGTRWTPLFGEAGFDRNSLELPDTQAGRFQMLNELGGFLTRHPEYADVRPMVNVTAESATVLLNKLTQARAAANVATTEKARALQERDAAIQNLRRRMIGLVAELRQLVELSDEAWYSFGFTPPKNASTPEGLSEPIAITSQSETHAQFAWGTARRATYYAIYIQIEGSQAPPTRVITRDRTYHLTDLPPNQRIKVSVAGVNRAGEGRRSELLQVYGSPSPAGD